MTGMRFVRVVPMICGTLAAATAWGAPNRPTYTKDVAPIMNSKCVVCHRAGESAPMSLTSFEEVRPWAKAIAKNVGERVMPPWHADKGVGVFTNDRSLSDDEVATIVKWVEQGAKQGDPKDMPALPEFPAGEWSLGEPDMVVSFKKIDLPAGGPDQFYNLPYQLDMPEDRWLRAVEVRPDNRKVTHHVIVYQTEGNNPPNGWLSAWAAGMEPMQFPEKTGRLVKKNATLIGDMHYHPADTAQSDTTSLGMYFAKDADIQKEVINLWIANQDFKIPAGNPSYKARSTFTFPQDSVILSVLPHMHYRGKSFSYTATYPDGRKELLMSTSNYDFNWQTSYMFKDPIDVPKGTRIDCIAEWDNSAANLRNPDPTRDVTEGSQSTDEMMIGFVDYIVKDGLRPVSPEQQVAERRVALIAEHPGEVYDAKAFQEGTPIAGPLFLPAQGAGSWHLAIMGNMYQATVNQIAWQGDNVTAQVTVAGFGTFGFEATRNTATGELKGKLKLPNGDEGLPVEGTLAK